MQLTDAGQFVTKQQLPERYGVHLKWAAFIH